MYIMYNVYICTCTYVRTYARARGAFMQLPRSKFGPSQLACLCYGERKKVVVIPEDKDINDISYLDAEFRNHFDYESNVSIISFRNGTLHGESTSSWIKLPLLKTKTN